MSAFSWSVSTPEGVAASGQCEFLVVPTTGGELGVLAGHAALVAGVLPGDLRVTAADKVTTVRVGAGVVEVRDNTVRVLVTRVDVPGGFSVDVPGGSSVDAPSDSASTSPADSAPKPPGAVP